MRASLATSRTALLTGRIPSLKRLKLARQAAAVPRASAGSGETGWVFFREGQDNEPSEPLLASVPSAPMLPSAGRILALPGSAEPTKFLSPSDAFSLTLGAALGQPAPVPEAPSSEETMTLPISKSPRRTMRIRFTCNKCQHRSARCINPNAYATGTVFVQCEGCLVHHKLVDNLNLFHELQARQASCAARLGLLEIGSGPLRQKRS